MSGYYQPKFLESLEVLALRARLLMAARNDPPDLGFFFAFSVYSWEKKHLRDRDYTTWSCIKTAVGEKEADEWLQAIFKEAGLYADLLDEAAN
jgi:hypothetical protein